MWASWLVMLLALPSVFCLNFEAVQLVLYTAMSMGCVLLLMMRVVALAQGRVQSFDQQRLGSVQDQ